MFNDKNTKNELMEEYKRLSSKAKSDKIPVPENAKSITAKSTKSDILAAIEALEQAFVNKSEPAEKKAEPTIKPAPPKNKVESVKKEEPATATKKEDIELNYLTQEIRNEINALETAKSLKKKEFETLLSIEKELVSFVEMINKSKNDNLELEKSQSARKIQQDAEDAESIRNLEIVNNEKLEKANDAYEQIVEVIQKNKEELDSARAAEQEQYDYDLSIKYKTEDDSWADELARREEAIAEVKKETESLQAEIDSKAELETELAAKIENIPEQIEKAKQEGESEKSKELGKEYGYKTAMAKKEAEVAAQSLQKQIDRLKIDYETVLAEKNEIQSKLDKAREESNKLYMETVRSTGGVKILRNADQN